MKLEFVKVAAVFCHVKQIIRATGIAQQELVQTLAIQTIAKQPTQENLDIAVVIAEGVVALAKKTTHWERVFVKQKDLHLVAQPK